MDNEAVREEEIRRLTNSVPLEYHEFVVSYLKWLPLEYLERLEIRVPRNDKEFWNLYVQTGSPTVNKDFFVKNAGGFYDDLNNRIVISPFNGDFRHNFIHEFGHYVYEKFYKPYREGGLLSIINRLDRKTRNKLFEILGNLLYLQESFPGQGAELREDEVFAEAWRVFHMPAIRNFLNDPVVGSALWKIKEEIERTVGYSFPFSNPLLDNP
jgi:hypothetical protein